MSKSSRFPLALVAFFAFFGCGCASARHKAANAASAIVHAPVNAVRAVRDIPSDLHPANSYQRAVLASSIFPGGGWVYMDNTDGGPVSANPTALWYWIATATAAQAFSLGTHHHDSRQANAALGSLALIRFTDIWWAARESKKRGPHEIHR